MRRTEEQAIKPNSNDRERLMSALPDTLQQLRKFFNKHGLTQADISTLQLNNWTNLLPKALSDYGIREHEVRESNKGFSAGHSLLFLWSVLTASPSIRAFTDQRCFTPELVPVGIPEFLQIDMVIVDESQNFASVKGLLAELLHGVYGASRKFRVRAKKVPFLAPGGIWMFEQDRSLTVQQHDAAAASPSPYIDLGAIGMLRPNILEAVGLDPERVSASFLSINVDFLAMDKYGITDARSLYG
jgi:phenylalanyl-tRNA synthetase alpha chain